MANQVSAGLARSILSTAIHSLFPIYLVRMVRRNPTDQDGVLLKQYTKASALDVMHTPSVKSSPNISFITLSIYFIVSDL